MLIKDYKSYFLLQQGEKGIGIGSIVVPLKLLLEHFGIENLCKEIDELMKGKNLGLFSIVTNYPDDQKNYHRELLFYMNS